MEYQVRLSTSLPPGFWPIWFCWLDSPCPFTLTIQTQLPFQSLLKCSIVPSIHPSIYSSTYPITPSSAHPSIHSLVYPSVHSFIEHLQYARHMWFALPQIITTRTKFLYCLLPLTWSIIMLKFILSYLARLSTEGLIPFYSFLMPCTYRSSLNTVWRNKWVSDCTFQMLRSMLRLWFNPHHLNLNI
jgi:hypothetical protein